MLYVHFSSGRISIFIFASWVAQYAFHQDIPPVFLWLLWLVLMFSNKNRTLSIIKNTQVLFKSKCWGVIKVQKCLNGGSSLQFIGLFNVWFLGIAAFCVCCLLVISYQREKMSWIQARYCTVHPSTWILIPKIHVPPCLTKNDHNPLTDLIWALALVLIKN